MTLIMYCMLVFLIKYVGPSASTIKDQMTTWQIYLDAERQFILVQGPGHIWEEILGPFYLQYYFHVLQMKPSNGNCIWG